MNTYKVPRFARNEKYWSQMVQNVHLGCKTMHLNNCGIGAISGFTGQPLDVKARRRSRISEWNNYMNWFSGNVARVQEHFRLPDNIVNAKQYAEHALERDLQNAETLAQGCLRIAKSVIKWTRGGAFHQVMFSGCVSEYVPQSKGQGAYHHGFHAGRFAAYLSLHPTLGHIYGGPITYNPNHASWVQAFSWVMPQAYERQRAADTVFKLNRSKYLEAQKS